MAVFLSRLSQVKAQLRGAPACPPATRCSLSPGIVPRGRFGTCALSPAAPCQAGSFPFLSSGSSALSNPWQPLPKVRECRQSCSAQTEDPKMQCHPLIADQRNETGCWPFESWFDGYALPLAARAVNGSFAAPSKASGPCPGPCVPWGARDKAPRSSATRK